MDRDFRDAVIASIKPGLFVVGEVQKPKGYYRPLAKVVALDPVGAAANGPTVAPKGRVCLSFEDGLYSMAIRVPFRSSSLRATEPVASTLMVQGSSVAELFGNARAKGWLDDFAK